MFDKIAKQLEETRDRQAVMILLQGLDEPMAVLTMKSDLITGELWIANGKQIVYAKVLPNGDGGLMDMLRLLAVVEGEFTLEKRNDKPPPCQVSIQVSELVADEHAVARKIKNVLWPVEEQSELGAEESTTTKKRKRSSKRTAKELETTHVRQAATDEALEAYVKEKNAQPDEQKSEAKSESKTESKTPEKPAEKVEAQPAPKAEAEPAQKADAKPAAKAEAKPESKEKAAPDPEASTKSEAEAPETPPALKGDLADALFERVEEVLSGGKTPSPSAAAGKGDKEAPAGSLASLFDDDDEKAEPAAAEAVAEEKPTPEAEPAELVAAKTATAETAGALAFELNAQLISAAAKAPPPPKPPAPPGKPTSTFSSIIVPKKTAEPAKAEADGAGKQWEGLSAKQQAHVVAMSALGGDDSENFYAESDAHDHMSEDSLAEMRKEESAALAQELAEDPDAFKIGKPKIIDPRKTSDEIKSRRRADYEALKLFYAEEPEKFKEAVGFDEKMDEGAGLTDFQKRILEISNEQSRDPDEFNLVDEKLSAGPDFRPAWDAGEPAAKTDSPEAMPAPGAGANVDDLEYVAQKVDSPYAESAPEVNLTTSLRKKLALEAEQQSMDLIDRIAKSTHLFSPGDEHDFRRQPMFRFIVAGVAGVVLIPLSAFIVWHFYDAQAQDDMAMQREAQRMAERSLEQKSMVTKPQEPFRMPAGNASASPPNGGGGGGDHADTGGANAITEQQRQAHYDWHPAAKSVAASPDEVASASRDMQQADDFVAAGNKDRALLLYVQGMRKYPSNALLRAKAARLCISLGQYKQAYMICQTGLDACQTRADFDMLVGIIREIP